MVSSDDRGHQSSVGANSIKHETLSKIQQEKHQQLDQLSSVSSDDRGNQLSVGTNSIKLEALSKILQEKLQQLGQLSCEIAKDETSVNGGWCSKISGADSDQHRTDEKLVQFLTKFLKGNLLEWNHLRNDLFNDI